MAVGGGNNDAVEQLITSASALGNNTIDLNRKNLRSFPKEVLDLQQLEFLYLEGNAISVIPEELFHKLPNLKWLDLRNNFLTELPSSVGKHRGLRNLLLEGNRITALPLELVSINRLHFEKSLVKSLSGLNLAGNPLHFPPVHILEKGTQEILKFLRDQFFIEQGNNLLLDEGRIPSASTSDESFGQINDVDLMKKGNRRREKRSSKSVDFQGPAHSPVPLHPPPVARTDRIRLEYDRQRVVLCSSDGKLETPRSDYGEWKERRRTNRSISGDSKVPLSSLKPHRSSRTTRPREPCDMIAEPKFPDYESRIAEEQRLALETALNEKEYDLLQKRKNKKALDEWRDQTRKLIHKKDYLARVHGSPHVAVEVRAPFGTEKSAAEDEKNKNFTHYTKKLKDIMSDPDKEAPRRALLDRELEIRIKKHIDKLKEHRRKTYDNISDELESARKNLELAQSFQRELEDKKGLEYRLRAFTGDDITLARRTKTHRPKKAPR